MLAWFLLSALLVSTGLMSGCTSGQDSSSVVSAAVPASSAAESSGSSAATTSSEPDISRDTPSSSEAAGNYTLENFSKYAQVGFLSKPEPIETADGIQISAKGAFWDPTPGITLKQKVDVDGFEFVYRYDSYDGKDADIPTIRLGFIEQPTHIAYGCAEEGASGSGFVVAQHMLDDGTLFHEGVMLDVEMGDIGGYAPLSEYLWGAGAMGEPITVKFAYKGEDNMSITVNGQEIPGDMKKFRAIADKNDGKMYFSCTADNHTGTKTIQFTIREINGKTVSSLQ